MRKIAGAIGLGAVVGAGLGAVVGHAGMGLAFGVGLAAVLGAFRHRADHRPQTLN